MTDHPLKVYHPGKGVHYVCRWWRHSEQHQIIVAPSEKAVRRIWESAYKKYDDAKAVGLYEVELVAPSQLMISKAIACQRDADIKNFINKVTGKIDEATKLGLPVPAQFTPCTKWESSYKYDEDHTPDSTTLKYHFDCRNCTNKFKLVSLTPEQFYDEFFAAWEKIFPPKKYVGRYQPVYSTASSAADDEIIWQASCSDFGHHRSGVNLVKCQVGEIPWRDANPWGFFYDVLFYFRMLQEMDVAPYNKAAQKYRDEEEKAWRERKELGAKLKRQQEKMAAEEFLAIFQGGNS